MAERLARARHLFTSTSAVGAVLSYSSQVRSRYGVTVVEKSDVIVVTGKTRAVESFADLS
ncbi:SH2 domain-containing protein [Streptomyces coelicoflavus]|uniref:hypothetical protein n=1 Tax=Streptomyces coelicoflavus TaxID=285562 RepID=UPI0036B5B8D0